MVVKLLGLLDILSGILIVALLTFGMNFVLACVIAFYLIIKSVIWFSMASLLDDLVALSLLFYTTPQVDNIILVLGAIWLIQKGIASVILT